MGRSGQDDFPTEDYGRRLATHQSAGRATLHIPDGTVWWKPKKVDKASHNIEVIPYRVTNNINRFLASYAKPGRWYPERTYYTHRNVGVNNEQYICPAKTFGKPCPICEEAARLKQYPDKESQERAKGMYPSERQLFLIYDLDDPKPGLQLWDVATFNFGKQLDAYITGAREKQQEQFRRFYHKTLGSTLRLVVEEKKMPRGVNHIYHVHEMYEREQEVPEKLYEHGFDLDAMIRETNYDTLKKIYLGLADEEDGGDNGDDGNNDPAPAPSRTRSPERNGRDHGDDDLSPRTTNRTASRATPAEAKPESKEEPRIAPKAEKPVSRTTEKAPLKFGTGDTVSFERRGEDLEGVIKKIDQERETASIEVDGFDRPMTYDFADLTLVKSDATFDLPKDDDGGENDAEKSFRPKPGDDDAAPPKSRGRPPGSKNK